MYYTYIVYTVHNVRYDSKCVTSQLYLLLHSVIVLVAPNWPKAVASYVAGGSPPSTLITPRANLRKSLRFLINRWIIALLSGESRWNGVFTLTCKLIMVILTSKALTSDHISPICSLAFSLLSSSVYWTVYWTVYTKAHNVNKNTVGKRTCLQPLGGVGGTLEDAVTRVPANSFTININSTNGNTSIKADFLKEAKPHTEFLRFV